jgi:hypothetical protein
MYTLTGRRPHRSAVQTCRACRAFDNDGNPPSLGKTQRKSHGPLSAHWPDRSLNPL